MRAAAISSALPRAGVDRRGMAVLSGGHLLTDVAQGAVPALLPFMIADRGYSIAAASALVLAATISSSVVQPLFGVTSDRRPLSWLLPTGLVVAGAGIALAGVAPSYELTFAAIVLSGTGVAAFHPEGARFANYVSGSRRASGMSLFSVGGNLGMALGPVVVTPLVLAFGLSGTLWLLVPYAIAGTVLAAELPRLRSFRPEQPSRRQRAPAGRSRWGAFATLNGVIVGRSFVFFSLVTLVPLWFVEHLGTSEAHGNVVLTAMLLGGAAGTLVGGPLADRIGRRPVLIGSLAVLPPPILALQVAGPGVATALLVLVGAAAICTFGITVVIGQAYLPDHLGLASGVTLGLSIGVGGIGAALIGLVADQTSLATALLVTAALPVPAVLLALALPRERT